MTTKKVRDKRYNDLLRRYTELLKKVQHFLSKLAEADPSDLKLDEILLSHIVMLSDLQISALTVVIEELQAMNETLEGIEANTMGLLRDRVEE